MADFNVAIGLLAALHAIEEVARVMLCIGIARTFLRFDLGSRASVPTIERAIKWRSCEKLVWADRVSSDLVTVALQLECPLCSTKLDLTAIQAGWWRARIELRKTDQSLSAVTPRIHP